jgi:hypothetical protein
MLTGGLGSQLVDFVGEEADRDAVPTPSPGHSGGVNVGSGSWEPVLWRYLVMLRANNCRR